MDWYRNGIRGPTRPDKANDRAGNAAVRETDRGGSGTNQPSRVPRYVLLAPATSVGGKGRDVKVGARFGARIAMHGYLLRRSMATCHRGSVDQSNGRWAGVAGNRAGDFRCSRTASTQYAESGIASNE